MYKRVVFSCQVTIHIWIPEEMRAYLVWSPGAWWREPWRLLTYGCVHASVVHLALNAVVALAVSIVYYSKP